MPVSREMRVVETEIDAEIQSLPVWKRGRATILEALMDAYRDSRELVFGRALHAEVFGKGDDFVAALGVEDRMRNGVFWALKWATEYCPETGPDGPISQEDLVKTICLGETYDTLVDVLKCADNDLVTLSVVREAKEILCYEGKDLTGFDAQIVDHQQTIGPLNIHEHLTADSDQLTSSWCAGDYRRATRQLAEYAGSKENTILVNPEVLASLGKRDISTAQPTLVWLERPEDTTHLHVFDSLTIPSKLTAQFMWRARSLLETPIVKVANHRFCALSSDLKFITLVDDYMLRLAARLDEKQYSTVSGLREERMMDACRAAFEGDSKPWKVRNRVKLTDPPQEADILASRSSESIVIEFKSTLRPETLREVHNRNSDVLQGLSQVESLVERGVASRGLLITDGYRGDYGCWENALRRDVTIGTLLELEDLARDPNSAIELMQQKAGLPTHGRTVRRFPDRKVHILGWKLRLVDGTPK